MYETNGPSTTDLLAACRDHDPDAWATLVARYERLVYSVARRNGLNAEDAADVTQTTFVALLDSLDRITEPDRLASWLSTVARRQSWRIRHRDAPMELVTEPSHDDTANVVEHLSLREAIRALPEKDRALVWYLFFDPAAPDYATVASLTGRTVSGIGPARGRALSRIRTHLTEVTA